MSRSDSRQNLKTLGPRGFWWDARPPRQNPQKPVLNGFDRSGPGASIPPGGRASADFLFASVGEEDPRSHQNHHVKTSKTLGVLGFDVSGGPKIP